MKGVIKKTISPTSLISINHNGLLKIENIIWEIEYQELQSHVTMSKMGNGPRDSSNLYVTKRLPLHPDDIYNSDGSLFIEDGKEVDFEIDYHTPLSLKFEKEMMLSAVQKYGKGARITFEVSWDDVKNIVVNEKNSDIDIIEEFKKRSYEIPNKAISEVKIKKYGRY